MRTKATPYDTTEDSSDDAVSEASGAPAPQGAAEAAEGSSNESSNNSGSGEGSEEAGEDAAVQSKAAALDTDMAKWSQGDWASKMTSEAVGFEFSFGDDAVAPAPQTLMAATALSAPAEGGDAPADAPALALPDINMRQVLRAARKTLAPAFCKSKDVEEDGVSATLAEWRSKRRMWKGAARNAKRKRTA